MISGASSSRASAFSGRSTIAMRPVSGVGRLSGLGPQAVSVRGGRLHRQHLQMRWQACANPPVRGRQCHADPLQGPAETEGLGLHDRQAINDAQGAGRSGSPPRDSHARDDARRDGVHIGIGSATNRQEAEIQLPRGASREGVGHGADSVRGQPLADCDFNLAALHPADPIKCRTSTQRTKATRQRRYHEEASALDPLERYPQYRPSAARELLIEKARAAPKTKSIISAALRISRRRKTKPVVPWPAQQGSTQPGGRHCRQFGSKPGQGGSGAAGQ